MDLEVQNVDVLGVVDQFLGPMGQNVVPEKQHWFARVARSKNGSPETQWTSQSLTIRTCSRRLARPVTLTAP